MKKVIVIAAFFLISLSTMAWAVDCPIPDTGQNKCYDYLGIEIAPCPAPGEPFYGQDAQYPCNPQSYTTLGGGIMVQDNVTGLIWEVKTIANMNNGYYWQDAQDVFIPTLNNDNFGGYSGWRLPTIKELSFIRNMDTHSPAIDTKYFSNTMSSNYWSSTSVAYDPDGAWDVYFRYGRMDYYGKSRYGYVRAVRGGQCGSFGDFVDNGNGTVTDTSIGLMWQQATAPGDYTWEQALSYCETLSLADYDDWRLPAVNELQSIVDYSTYNPSIDTKYFSNTVSSSYWSSTSYVSSPSYAWIVDFYGGGMDGNVKSYSHYVRAVRGGQCGSFDTSTTTTVASTTTIDGSTTTTTDDETTTTITTCSSEVIYGEYSAETELLRYFRDNVLSQTPTGQEIIRLYYQWSPVIVKAMEEDDEFKAGVKEMIDGVLELIVEEAE